MSHGIAEPEIDREASRPRRSQSPLVSALKALASLRLTVVLFSLSLVLVFVGTLAQLNDGVWTVVERYFRSFYVLVPVQLFVQLGQVFLGVPPTFKVPFWFPFPGGYTLGLALLVNLLAAHAIRFKFTLKRAGVMLLHLGLIVLILNEFITGTSAIEARMTIYEGETANYIDESRKTELAVIDSSDPKADDVVVVPGAMLKEKVGEVLADADLPFDVRVEAFSSNSEFVNSEDAEGPDVFPVGPRFRMRIVPRDGGSGVDTNAHDDMPFARVTLLEKGTTQEIGTYVVSLWLYPNLTAMKFAPQTARAGGKAYTLQLRPKRSYKPYALTLNEVRHDVYVGTTTPKNYSSRVRLVDGSESEDRDVTISMNAPLRYRGETFYQSSVLGTMKAGEKRGTVLQVVRNPGWTLPYVACFLVTLGMTLHFGLKLSEFLSKRGAA